MNEAGFVPGDILPLEGEGAERSEADGVRTRSALPTTLSLKGRD